MYLCDTVGNVWLVVRKQLVSKLSQKKEKKKPSPPPTPKKPLRVRVRNLLTSGVCKLLHEYWGGTTEWWKLISDMYWSRNVSGKTKPKPVNVWYKYSLREVLLK